MPQSKQISIFKQSQISLAMQQLISDDRSWFVQHPEALVRFRPAQNHEFEIFETLGEVPPSFIPSGYSKTIPRNWVAVVELMRIAGADPEANEENLRLRICTVPIRSKRHQAKATDELIQRITNELQDLKNNNSSNQLMTGKAA